MGKMQDRHVCRTSCQNPLTQADTYRIFDCLEPWPMFDIGRGGESPQAIRGLGLEV